MHALENAHRSPVRRDFPQHPDLGLRDHNANRENIRSSPRKPVEVYEDDYKRPCMHKKTKSAVSLKSLIGNDRVKPTKLSWQESEDGTKLKRPKSSTALSALLTRSKTPKEPKSDCKSPTKDKENRTPPQSADLAPPPIWAQYATQNTSEPRKSTSIPLADRNDVEKEIAPYAPKEYSPSRQRNFYDYRPTLSRKSEQNPRPLYKIMGPGSTEAHVKLGPSTQRQPVVDRKQLHPMAENRANDESSMDRLIRGDKRVSNGTDSNTNAETQVSGISHGSASSAAAKVKRGSRIMAAMATFDGSRDRACERKSRNTSPPELDTQAVESQFETLLVSQPDYQR